MTVNTLSGAAMLYSRLMRITSALALSAILLLSSPTFAQTDWISVDRQEALARQLIERFKQVGIELPSAADDQLARGRTLIQKLVSRVDAWGLEGLVGNAPELAKIALPEFDDRIISALAIYGACSIPLRADLVNTASEKSVVVLGEMSVAIISAFLTHQYLASGGTEEELAEALSSTEMDRLFYEIQSIDDTRNYIATECGPAFEALWKS